MLSSECRSVDIPRARLSSILAQRAAIAGIAIGCCVACICPAIFATFANPTTNAGLHAFRPLRPATQRDVLPLACAMPGSGVTGGFWSELGIQLCCSDK
jgi:hypothetical protein